MTLLLGGAGAGGKIQPNPSFPEMPGPPCENRLEDRLKRCGIPRPRRQEDGPGLLRRDARIVAGYWDLWRGGGVWNPPGSGLEPSHQACADHQYRAATDIDRKHPTLPPINDEYRKAILCVLREEDYQTSRAGRHAAACLDGYKALFRDGSVVELACMAHARCKFFDLAKANGGPVVRLKAYDLDPMP